MSVFTPEMEMLFFDGIATEMGNLFGIQTQFYSFDKVNSSKDTVYNEPTSFKYIMNGGQPFQFNALIMKPGVDPQATEKGFNYEFGGTIWLVRAILDAGSVPYPKEGDIIYVFSPIVQRWFGAFEMSKVEPDGYINELGTYSRFECTVVRNTVFVPERKLNS
jgi:hypothetical protein